MWLLSNHSSYLSAALLEDMILFLYLWYVLVLYWWRGYTGIYEEQEPLSCEVAGGTQSRVIIVTFTVCIQGKFTPLGTPLPLLTVRNCVTDNALVVQGSWHASTHHIFNVWSAFETIHCCRQPQNEEASVTKSREQYFLNFLFFLLRIYSIHTR